ncbi:ABC transporter permease subunit [Salmonella enterica subsp. enterica serovar Infantis]
MLRLGPGNNAGTALLSERLRHLVLPVCALSLLGMGQIALHTREKIASVMKSEFIRFARAQGDKGWSLLRHQVLRHAITPALCLQFASLGELMGGRYWQKKSLRIRGWDRPLSMPACVAMSRYSWGSFYSVRY